MTAKAVGFIASVSIVLHLVLLVMWNWRIRPELERAQRAKDAAVPMLARLPTAPSSWSRIERCGVRLRVPARVGASGPLPETDPAGSEACTIPLDAGSLRVFSAPLDMAFSEVAEWVAPHPSDVALWSPPWRNWRMIVALAWRADHVSLGSSARRFETATARGAVVTYHNRGVERHVIYVFGDARCDGRLVTTTRVTNATLLPVLESLDACPRSARRDAARP